MKNPQPLIQKYTPRWWKAQISESEERRKKFIEQAEESIRVYNAQKNTTVMNDVERRINVWWYCINTLLPAYYSSTPQAEVDLRKRSGSLPYQLGSVILERNTQYAMDVHFSFDQVGYLAALQFLLTGQAVLWARYEPKFETVMQEIALFKTPEGLMTGEGKPYEGDTSNLVETDSNIVMVSVEVERKVDEKAVLEVVQYNDYFCSDARTEAEVEWRARRAFLDRERAENMFGADVAKTLSYTSYPEVIKKAISRKDDKYEGKAEVFEIWCETTNKVYWLSKDAEKPIIETSAPPIKFEKFYPCSVITQSDDPDSVIPVSDYTHVRDQVLEVERLTTRIHAVTQAIRTNSVYDSTLGDQIEQLLTGDLKLIPVTNWPSYKMRGGLASGVESFNIAPYIEALQVLQTARQTALGQLYETLKVSDLLRGTSEQYKSATANRLENAWSSMGLIVRQNMFAKFVSDAVSNLAAIIAEQFDEETILDIGNVSEVVAPLIKEPAPPPPPAPEQMPEEGMPPQEMQPPAPPPPPMPSPEEQIQQFAQAIISILRDNKQRSYRIQVSTDSMVAVNESQQQQEGMQLIQTTGAFFDQMRGLVEQYPPLMQFSMSLFQNMIKRFKGGKELDAVFTQGFEALGEIIKAKEEAAKQPPPPDPVMQEVQGRLQIAQIEAEARMASTQMEMQDKSVKNQIAMQEQQVKMQRDQLEAQLAVQKYQLEEYIAQQELAIKQQEVQVKQSKVQVEMLQVQAESTNESSKQAIQQETAQMNQILEIQKLQLEQMRIKLSETEKLMEERRLNSEQELERIRLAMQSITEQSKETAAKAQPIVINNVMPKRAKRKANLINDELGNLSGIELADIEEEEES
jgi:hypothetical protein